MGSVVIALTCFGLIFVGELPDKTAVAALILGSRYSPGPVLTGIYAAFTIHVVLACAVGGLIAQLPREPVELVSAALFLVGAVLLLRSDPAKVEEAEEEVAGVSGVMTPRKVATASFGVVLVAEFGDLTQILTASLAARYNDPVAVGIGALLALWAVAGIAVGLGRTLLRVVPLKRVQQVAAAALLALTVYSLISALT